MDCDCLLLDIEGTTSSVSFVYDEMFPFVRKHLHEFLEANWGDESLEDVFGQIADDRSLSDPWPDPALPGDSQRAVVAAEVLDQMDNDLKTTGLKRLQGMIWKQGFESGELQAHVYPDVKPALEKWKSAKKEIHIYSSGSVQAQLLFFGHTVDGDLLPFFGQHFDTTIGSKREAQSYREIADVIDVQPERILFVSDIVEELDCAREAGMQTRLSLRPGNAEVKDRSGHTAIESFQEI